MPVAPKYRLRIATRSLVKTRIEMERHTHNIVRLFRDSPIAMNVVYNYTIHSASYRIISYCTFRQCLQAKTKC